MNRKLSFFFIFIPLVGFAAGKKLTGCEEFLQRIAQGDFSIQNHSLVIVHADRFHDFEKNAKPGIDEVIKLFKSKGRSTYALTHDEGKKWYTRDKSMTGAVASAGGEHRLTLPAQEKVEVTVVGGFDEGCLTEAVKDLIQNTSAPKMRINLPTAAMYSAEGGRTSNGKIHSALRENPKYVRQQLDLELSIFEGLAKTQGNFDYDVVLDGKIVYDYSSSKIGEHPRRVRFQLWSSNEKLAEYLNRPEKP